MIDHEVYDSRNDIVVNVVMDLKNWKEYREWIEMKEMI